MQATPLEVSDPATFAHHVLQVSVITVVLCLPAVTRATGIPAPLVVAIIGAHLAWTAAVAFGLRPSLATPARFHVALAGSVVLNTSIVIAFPALSGDARSPLWMIGVMYACFNGSSQEMEPSVGVLLIHILAPLVAIPVLLAQGATGGWVIGAPLLCSAVSATAYNQMAQVSAIERQARQANADALAALRTKLEQDDRARLARDLHDSVGSSLAVVGLYGDLIERHAEQPDQLRAIAGMVREAADEGAVELAALMGAIMPASADVDGVVATLIENGRRAARSSGATIDVRVLRGGSALLDGTTRLALVRVFQESLHNALEHGAGKHVNVTVAADDDRVSIEISDDGVGFVIADAPPGRGLSGMRARAADLGGTFSVTATPSAGTTIGVTLPRARPA